MNVEVEVSVERSTSIDTAFISVRDFGQGVPEERLRDIFHPFFPIDPATMSGENNGLELTIASGAIQLHREA